MAEVEKKSINVCLFLSMVNTALNSYLNSTLKDIQELDKINIQGYTIFGNAFTKTWNTI